MIFKRIDSILVGAVLLLFTQGKLFGQNNHVTAISKADTTGFINNISLGWEMFNSYVAKTGSDSVNLSVIIQHERNINWGQEQFIGKIKTGLNLPVGERMVDFSILSDQYRMRILSNGMCYLRLLTGYLPGGNPVVLPIKLKYKL